MSLVQVAGVWMTLGGLFTGYVGVVAALTVLRRRGEHGYVPAQAGRVRQAAAPPPQAFANPLPEQWRLPVQPGTPDDITILIRPDEATLARMAIRRAIDHLEEAS